MPPDNNLKGFIPLKEKTPMYKVSNETLPSTTAIVRKKKENPLLDYLIENESQYSPQTIKTTLDLIEHYRPMSNVKYDYQPGTEYFRANYLPSSLAPKIDYKYLTDILEEIKHDYQYNYPNYVGEGNLSLKDLSYNQAVKRVENVPYSEFRNVFDYLIPNAMFTIRQLGKNSPGGLHPDYKVNGINAYHTPFTLEHDAHFSEDPNSANQIVGNKYKEFYNKNEKVSNKNLLFDFLVNYESPDTLINKYRSYVKNDNQRKIK